jgi:hypothetical protein
MRLSKKIKQYFENIKVKLKTTNNFSEIIYLSNMKMKPSASPKDNFEILKGFCHFEI